MGPIPLRSSAGHSIRRRASRRRRGRSRSCASFSPIRARWSRAGRPTTTADNLAPSFLTKIAGKYEGTRIGRQELYAELLDDVPGALWTWERIEQLRVRAAPELRRVVVAIDPAVSSSETSDETGIIVAGAGECRCRGKDELHGFVLADFSDKYSPNGWAQKAVMAYHSFEADRIVAETNNGGELVEMNLRTVGDDIPFEPVRAAQGKRTRAEPIAALYEQGKVHHVGLYGRLEEQLTTWDPLASTKSPDRLDALVWALSVLMLEDTETTFDKYMRAAEQDS